MHNFVPHRGEGFVKQLYSEKVYCCAVRAVFLHALIVITASHKCGSIAHALLRAEYHSVSLEKLKEESYRKHNKLAPLTPTALP